MKITTLCLPLFSMTLVACGGGSGSVTASAYGESYIEEGIHSTEMADGWGVTFDEFLVTFEDVEIAGASLPGAHSVNLVQPSSGQGQILGVAEAPSGTHVGASFTVSRIEVAGSAIRGEEIRSFSWLFEEATRYERCEVETALTSGDEASFQMTIHADHLFYDSLVATEPELRFQALADADTDGDQQITATELAGVGLGAYDPGNAPIDDLWTFLVAQSRTVGHVNGEGHCEASPVVP